MLQVRTSLDPLLRCKVSILNKNVMNENTLQQLFVLSHVSILTLVTCIQEQNDTAYPKQTGSRMYTNSDRQRIQIHVVESSYQQMFNILGRGFYTKLVFS